MSLLKAVTLLSEQRGPSRLAGGKLNVEADWQRCQIGEFHGYLGRRSHHQKEATERRFKTINKKYMPSKLDGSWAIGHRY